MADDINRWVSKLSSTPGPHLLSTSEILGILTNLQAADPYDAITFQLIPIILAAIHSVHDKSGWISPLIKEKKSISQFQSILSRSWKSEALQGIVMLQWALFLKEAQDTKLPNIESELSLPSGGIEGLMREAATMTSAFEFLTKCFATSRDQSYLPNQRPGSTTSAQGVTSSDEAETKKDQIYGILSGLDIDPEFKRFVFRNVDSLVRNLVLTFSSTFRSIKLKEDDRSSLLTHPIAPSLHPSSRATANMKSLPLSQAGASLDPSTTSTMGPETRNAIDAFLLLIAALYQHYPDSGLPWWTNGGGLLNFLRICSSVSTPSNLVAYFQALGSLATGPKSAESAYYFLLESGASGASVLSWSFIVDSLSKYANYFRKNYNGQRDLEFDVDELTVLLACLRMLSQVSKFSSLARTALATNPRIQAVNNIFNLASCRVPVQLKAALFDSLAAFCVPLPEGSGISVMIWDLLERSQILQTVNVGPAAAAQVSSLQYPGSVYQGILFELEEIESRNETYPETRAFLSMLIALVEAPRSGEERARIAHLGEQFRSPGIGPYINFVMDHVFTKAHNRLYVFPEEKWQILDLCLHFFWGCLSDFDVTFWAVDSTKTTTTPPLDSFTTSRTVSSNRGIVPANPNSSNSTAETELFYIKTHPGFEVLTRLLSGSKFLEDLLEVLVLGTQKIHSDFSHLASLASSILFSLQILLRTLNVQRIFLDIVIPDLLDTAMGAPENLPPYMSPLEQHLIYRKNSIVQIANLINYQVSLPICLFSIKVMTVLSSSSILSGAAGPLTLSASTAGGHSMNRLVVLLDNAPEKHQIMEGYMELLRMEEPERASESELAESGLRGMDSDVRPEVFESSEMGAMLKTASHELGEGDEPLLVNQIRLAIADLLIEGIQRNSSTGEFSFAHILLGLNVKDGISKTQIPDPNSPNASLSCLHVILDLVRVMADQSQLRLKSRNPMDGNEIPLSVRHPTLSEKFYQLLYLLCSNRQTSSPVIRYLRTRENFAIHQFSAMPVLVESMVIADTQNRGSAIDHQLLEHATATTLFAQLHQRAWLMEIVALDLHLSAQAGLTTHVVEILNMLYQCPNFDEIDMTDESSSLASFFGGQSTVTPPAHKYEQPLMKMLEILNSLDFVWDEPELYHRDLKYFSEVDFSQFLCSNDRGATVYDLRATFAVLKDIERRQIQQGGLGNSDQRKGEMQLIMNDLLQQNRIRELFQSRLHCVRAWIQIVELTLTACFDHLLPEIREALMYEILSAVLPKINMSSTPGPIALEMTFVVMTLLYCLKEDRNYQFILQSASFKDDSSSSGLKLPVDLLHSIFGGIIESIQKPGTTIEMRGLLYGALLHYIHYTSPQSNYSASLGGLNQDKETTFHSDMSMNSVFSDKAERPLSSYRASLISGNAAILAKFADRLLEPLCNDAADGHEFWKTVAFSCLNALASLGKKDRGSIVLRYVTEKNYLTHFISGLKKESQGLLESLQSEPDTLNPLYIYEAKMHFLLRLAEKREGVDKLLENQIVEYLSELSFIDQRPEESHFEDDDFIHSGRERYHMLFAPILKLLISILSVAGKENKAISTRVSRLVHQHYDVFLNVLKDKSPQVSIQGLEEMRLMTKLFSLMGDNRPLLDKVLPGAGKLSFHSLLVNLFTKYSHGDRVLKRLRMSSEVEDSDSILRLARSHILDIHRSLLCYYEEISRHGSSYLPMFSPSFAPVQDNSSSELPPLSLLTQFTQKAVNDYFSAIAQFNSLRFKSTDPEGLTMDEVAEITQGTSEKLLKELGPLQRQHLASRELSLNVQHLGREIRCHLYIVEHSLILLKRHLDFYLRRVRSPPTRTQRPSITIDVDSLLSESITTINPILAKLSNLELDQDIAGSNYESRSAFISMLIRRLKDTLENDGPRLQ